MKGFRAFSGLAPQTVTARFGGILKRRRTGVAWATGVLLLVAFGVVVAHHAEGRRLAELLRGARPAWLAATLLARGFTFWLPMAPGLAIARREMMHETASAEPTAGAETP